MTNADFEKIVDTTDEWIVSRTGISERHIASDDISSADMASKAAERALESAGLTHEDIDLVICGTVTPGTFLFRKSAIFARFKRSIPPSILTS